MPSFTLRTSWKRPETLRTLMARRRWIVRLAGIGLVVRGVAKAAVMGVDADGGMVAIGIVEAVRRCRLAAMRKLRWKRLGVLLRLRTRCWTRRRVSVGRKKRLVTVHRVRMDRAGGVGVADGGVAAELRVKDRVRRRLAMKRMSLV